MRYFRIGRYLQRTDDFLKSFPEDLVERQEINIGYAGNLGERIKDDIVQFSLPALLRYEDKNSSAHSIEARVPFLDHQLIEYTMSLPLDQKLHSGWTKYILRQAMKGILPESIRLRKSKLGFSVPEVHWFKQVLHNKVRITLQNPQFIADYVNIPKLLQSFDRFASGRGLGISDFFFRCFILEKWGQKFMVRGNHGIDIGG